MPAARKLRPGRRPFPRQQQPDLVRARYQRALFDLVALMQQLAYKHLRPILARLPEQKEDARQRLDADKPSDEEVAKALEAARKEFERQVADDGLARLTLRVARDADVFQRGQFSSGVSRHLGVSPASIMRREPKLAAPMRAFVRENVELIKTLPGRYFGQVAEVVQDGIVRGRLVGQVRDALMERTGVAKSNAARIAHDQVGKWNGKLNELRQRALGVSRYVWRTVGDNRVREEHDDLNGEVFEWDDPPEDGHPGQPINCRCSPEPVLDEEDLPDQEAEPEPDDEPDEEAAPDEGAEPVVGTIAEEEDPGPTPVVRERKGWRRERVYEVPISELEDVPAKAWEPGRAAAVSRGIERGEWEDMPPVRLVTASKAGDRELVDGNHRLALGRATGQATIKVQFLDRPASRVRERPPREQASVTHEAPAPHRR